MRAHNRCLFVAAAAAAEAAGAAAATAPTAAVLPRCAARQQQRSATGVLLAAAADQHHHHQHQLSLLPAPHHTSMHSLAAANNPWWPLVHPWTQGLSTSAAAASAADAATAAAASSSSSTDGIIIDQTAVERLKQLQAEQPPGVRVVLRVEVEGGGCSGFQYKFRLDSSGASGPDDLVFERDGVAVVCDAVSLDFLRGAVVEYEDSLMRSAFQIATNPNSESTCGCGTSFVAKL